MDSKIVLIAGGAGFIGSHLCKELLKRGYKVFCIDNLITGNEQNIQDLKKNKEFIFINQDILAEEFDISEKIDYIYHLASPASPIQYQQHPIETLMVNSVGTKNLLEIARKNHAKFLFTSTSEVYGDPKEHPQKETYWGNVNSFGPRACYDEAKRFGEALVYSYISKYDVDARIVRIFNTYGPFMEQNDGRVISNFVTQALSNKPITIYGNGKQSRSFCYVDDMVEGIVRAMEYEQTNGKVLNLGNPDERTIDDIAKLIVSHIGQKENITYTNRPIDDPEKRRPDISRAKELLGWDPKISLEEGIAKTIDYFKSILSTS